MKTILIPTPERKMLAITQESDPEQFHAMTQAASEIKPLAEIAHLTFYDTFHIMDESKQCSPAETMKAGAYLVDWLIAQDIRFQARTNANQEKTNV